MAVESVMPSDRPAFHTKQALLQELELQYLLSLLAGAGAGLSLAPLPGSGGVSVPSWPKRAVREGAQV